MSYDVDLFTVAGHMECLEDIKTVESTDYIQSNNINLSQTKTPKHPLQHAQQNSHRQPAPAQAYSHSKAPKKGPWIHPQPVYSAESSSHLFLG